MRRYRFLRICLVCLLFLLTGLSEGNAGNDSLDFFALRGIEKMATDPLILKDPGKDILFEPVSDGVLRLPSFNNSTWFRIPMQELIEGLERQSPEPGEDGILLLSSPHITHVDCFLPHTLSSYARFTFGKGSEKLPQFLYTRYPVLWLPSLKDFFKEGYAYLNVRSDYPVSATLLLLTPVPFIHLFFKSLILQISFVGIMVSFVVAYFLFYMMTGEKKYRAFMLLQMGLTLLSASFNGHFNAYLKLPASAIVFITWGAFGLASIVGGHFFYKELLAHSRIQRTYKPAMYAQYLLVPAILAAAMNDRFLWVFIMGSVSLALSIAGALLLFIQMIREKARMRSLVLYLSSQAALFIGAGIMFLSSYYTPYWFSRFFYSDLLYMAFLITASLLMILLNLLGSRARFDGYNLLQAQSARYRELSERDGLTGLYNRFYLEQALKESIKQAEKTGRLLSFIMLDIDHFKRFNDTWGHQEGDRALKLVAKVIRDSLREQDVAARYGGEEFSVILSEADQSIAAMVAERIRRSCAGQSQSLGEGKALTVSLGISLLRSEDTPETLIQRADKALYQAKGNGRNRVEVAFSQNAP